MNQQTDTPNPRANMTYIIVVVMLTFVLPAIGTLVQVFTGKDTPLSFALFGKWFIFSAVGLRLFLAGIRQTTQPAFTAKEIFHIDSPNSFPIVCELGFANLCFGLIGIVSLLVPAWRVISAFGSGIFYGLAALQHLIKKPAGTNEMVALVTDFFIFILLLVYFVTMI